MQLAEVSPGRRPLRARVPRRLGSGWLVTPLLGTFVVFYIVPVVALIGLGLNRPDETTIRVHSALSSANYTTFFSEGLYLRALGWSLCLALATTVLTALLGFFPAYLIARARGNVVPNVLLALVLLPLQADISVRIYGLVVLLGNNGLVNQALVNHGVTSSPVHFIYNLRGDLIGLTELCLPFMILILSVAIRQVDVVYHDVARSLGARWWQTVRTIVLPLAAPGLLAASLLVFSIAFGNYNVPVLLGNFHPTVVTIYLDQSVASLGQWQFGAALATIVLIPTLAIAGGFYLLFRRFASRAALA